MCLIPLKWQDLDIDPQVSIEFLLLQAPGGGGGESSIVLKYENINSKRVSTVSNSHKIHCILTW